MSGDPFANDVLERLVLSNQDYQRSHGHYIVPLAQRLLDARAERDQARAQAERLADTIEDYFNLQEQSYVLSARRNAMRDALAEYRREPRP